ncbi:MAG: YbjQ family protein [Candidatus Dormibacteraceae bacterium]
MSQQQQQPVQQQPPPLDPRWVTTAFEIRGARVARSLGVVRGVTVRSRSAFGNIGASFQALGGGNITLYTELAEHARQEAYFIMCGHAAQLGANGVIGMRYDANDIQPGITEVIAYGTAVVFEADPDAH